MQMQVAKSKSAEFISSILPENWQQQLDANFSSDDLINAYMKGKSDGENQVGKIIMDRFTENVKKASKIAEQFIELTKEKGVQILNAHLRVDNIAKFTVLFVVSEEDYLSNNFRNLYLLANFLKSTSNTDSFDISFTFTNHSEHLSSECLSADGYIMRYGNSGKA